MTVRVRYPEIDRMGVAYHAHYLVWFELGRTEWMRHAGRSYRDYEDEDGLRFPVVEAGARYVCPARYDDVLSVHTQVARVGGARVRFEYRVEREGAVLASGFTEHAVIGADGRARRIPADLARRLGGEELAR